jgi:nucleoside triphosphate pyrophosphatase
MAREIRWILASASPRRREILSGVGLSFSICPSHVPEPPPRCHETASSYAVRVARLKGREIAASRRSGIVIAADTIVVAGADFLGKPASRAEGRRMIRSLSGRWHEVVTGLCLTDCAIRRTVSGYSRTRVHFRRLLQSEIEWYLDTAEYRDKAGAYAIQGHASLFIDRIEGCYFNVVGFPVQVFERLASKLDIPLIAAAHR